MHIAEYFKGKFMRAKREAKEWEIPDVNTVFSNISAIDEKKLEFMMNIWSEEDLCERMIEEIHDNDNVVFLRIVLKEYPHFRFHCEEGNGDGDEEASFYSLSLPATIIFCLLQNGRREEFIDAFNTHKTEDEDEDNVLNPSLCLIIDMCSIDVRVCKCGNQVLRREEQTCPKCIENMLPKCSHIFSRGKRRGDTCGGPAVPGTNLCRGCVKKAKGTVRPVPKDTEF